MKRFCTFLFATSLLLAIAACHSGNNPTLAPNVVGLTVIQATAKLKISGLVLGTQTTAPSATVPVGEIISQSPIAGTSVDSGSAVDVIVSSGPPPVTSATARTSPFEATAEVAAPVTEDENAALVHAFGGSAANSSVAASGLTRAADGNVYGLSAGGGSNQGRGAFFRITPRSVKTVLYSFGGRADDAIQPDSPLIQGTDGNFYGTSALGGAYGEGTVFRITPAGTESVLYSFTGAVNEPARPSGGVIQGADGNFYGATRAGGANGSGVVFKLTPAGALSVLYSLEPANQ